MRTLLIRLMSCVNYGYIRETGAVGLEPTTGGLEIRYSIRLSYAPKNLNPQLLTLVFREMAGLI